MPQYDRKAAVDYATTYTATGDTLNISYNPAYVAYPGTNDCTNFVSQALFAGGWPMKGSWIANKGSNNVWWYGLSTIGNTKLAPKLLSTSGQGGKASDTWIGADKFADFLTTSGRAMQVPAPDMLDLGDVVQLQNSNGVIHHTMIVTDIDPGTAELMLSYHSNNQLNNPLSAVLASMPGDVPIYWRIKDQIP